MGVRIRRIAPICAVLATLATGCVVGPTIDDEKPKAANAGATGNPTDLPDKNVPGQPPGAPATGGTPEPPGDAAPDSREMRFGTQWAELGQGARVTVTDVRKDTTATATTDGSVPLLARINVDNRSPITFSANSLTVWIADAQGHRPCRMSIPPGSALEVRIPSGVVGLVDYKCTSLRLNPALVRIEVALGGTGTVTFRGDLAASVPSGPAQGPATQPGTVIVPRSTPVPGAPSASSTTAPSAPSGRTSTPG
jgi:hypothetical protein